MTLRYRIATFWILLTLLPQPMAAERPNFLLLLLDDAGWTDAGCYGSRIETPHLDRLAREGMRFSDCHSAAPNCSPSRAGLLTGRIPARTGIYSYLPAGHVMHLRESEVTVAELLQARGYQTGLFGKWHLSRLNSAQPDPGDQGFDHWFATDNNASPSHLDPRNFIENGTPAGPLEGYSCQLVADRAIDWLEGCSSARPFFLCVWFHEPHTPIASPPELVRKYRERHPEMSRKEATYHANVENADRAIGRILDHLDSSGRSGNTLVFATSDNGPLGAFSSRGLRGRKSHVWEGGHRVPGLFRWPGRIPPGTTSAVPVSGIDYLPTVCESAGIESPPDRVIDGVSLIPLLSGHPEDFHREDPLYWFFYRVTPSLALREGKWSLIADTDDAERPKAHQMLREDMPLIRSGRPVRIRLYDLEGDPLQQTDLAATRPGVLRRLAELLENRHAGIVEEGHQWDIPADYNADARRRLWSTE